MTLPKRDRKKGNYICSYPACGKTHTRMDHLRRHEKTHDPKLRYYCHWPGCKLSFTRSDVRLNHYKKHEDTSLLLNAEMHESGGETQREDLDVVDFEQLDHGGVGVLSTPVGGQVPVDGLKHLLNRVTSVSEALTVSEIPNSVPATPIEKPISDDPTGPTGPAGPAGTAGPVGPLEMPGPNFLSPSDLIELFFLDENSDVNNTVGIHPNYSSEFPNGFSPLSELEKMFSMPPNFPHVIDRKYIDDSIFQTLLRQIPSLSTNSDFEIPKLEYFMEIYWLIYHPQYPILHKPSFSTRNSEPLLLLCMIMFGAALSYTIPKQKKYMKLDNPKLLADSIAEPLRWLIFSHPVCKPPAEVWIVQCLLILETYEITSTTRALHERAYMFHGTKIQLLRRSPILGGDPQKGDEEDNNNNNNNNNNGYRSGGSVWKHWIESESMKRATYMAFYIDTVHATVYGHLIILYAHQIHLSLPCEDRLWEFDNTPSTSSVLPEVQTQKFHSALRRLLKRQKVETSSFGKKILLGGLLTIMFQMLQKDLRLSNKEWDSVLDTWKDAISLAIDVWRREICNDECCHTRNSYYLAADMSPLLPTMLRPDDKRCKFSLYHISQIYLRITHYDYIIYAGAPSRMNVPVRREEYDAVSKRVEKWSSEIHGRVSAVHAYLFLFEMLLVDGFDDLNYSYDPNSDPFLHRKNIVISAVLVIFAYNFSLEGPESEVDTSSTRNDYKEDAHSYLRRIQCSLVDAVHPHQEMPYHEMIKVYAETLPSIENKNHIVGLLKLFYKSYKNSNWEIGREYSNLLRNCIERCLGRPRVTCYDMYEKSVNNPIVY